MAEKIIPKKYEIKTGKGGKITLSEEEMKAHQETLRRHKILTEQAGKKAVEELEKELEKLIEK